MKIILEYDASTGTLRAKSGAQMCRYLLQDDVQEYQESPRTDSTVSELVNLKHSGFETDDLIRMKREGLI